MAKRRNGEVRLIDELTAAVRKRALGYECDEVNEEYATVDGELTLVKKKVKRAYCPPDISAIKLMLEIGVTDVSAMTEEELEAEKFRLIRLLKENENGATKNGREA